MKTKKEIVMIHGTWGNGPDTWAQMVPEMERRGYVVHTPTLRYHDLPFLEGAVKIARLGLLDYVEDLKNYVEKLEKPPLIFGVSMGGLLAQLVAARTRHPGLVLFAPAPAYGMLNLYPGMIRIFLHHFLQWGFWRKPLYPEWNAFRWGVANEQPEDKAFEFFKTSCTESGKAYSQMAFWWLDPLRSSRVNVREINSPVLVFGGGKDRVVHPRISRLTATRYQKGTYIHLPDSDHLMILGHMLPTTLKYLDEWFEQNGL